MLDDRDPSRQGHPQCLTEAPDVYGEHEIVNRRKFLQRTGLVAGGVLIGSTLRPPAAWSAVSHGGLQPTGRDGTAFDALGPGSPATNAPMGASPVGPSTANPTARGSTLFGIGYETWFEPGVNAWGSAEAKPMLGYYNSNDTGVITQHAKWLSDAGFNFILIDWSNNLGANWQNGVAEKIIGATMKLLQVYTVLPRHPSFVLLLGLDNGEVGTANFNAQIDLINTRILANPNYASMWQQFSGKPLLPIYRGPAFAPPPSYANNSFTVRWMSAFHESTTNPWGDWSWLDRQPIVNGPMFPVSPFSASSFGKWKADSNWSLGSGPFPGSYAPYATTEPSGDKAGGSLTSPPFAVTERTLTFNVAGVDFFQTTHTDYSLADKLSNRNLFFLRDARTGQVLRHAEPPQLVGATPFAEPPTFAMRQWDVSDLLGREVIFQAVNNSTMGPQLGWLAVGNVALTRNEQLSAAVAVGGNEGPASFTDWDAHVRNSGSTLVRFAQTAYQYEPDVVLIQQWNEFLAPDQQSVEGSNDIEPTIITGLDGPASAGWGTYYLDLSTSVIRQYRQGFRIPHVTLDTLYP